MHTLTKSKCEKKFNEIKLENKLSLLDKREKKNHSAKKLKVHGNRGVEIFHHTGQETRWRVHMTSRISVAKTKY